MNRFYYILLITLIFISCNEVNQERELIYTYIDNYCENNNLSYVDIGISNSNDEIIKTINRYLLPNNEGFKNDSVLSKIFIKTELENYENQLSSGKWNNIFNGTERASLTQNEKESNLYITKPIFTTNKKYALIYSYKKGKNGIYLTPRIEIYRNESDEWNKIREIKHFQ